MLDLVSSKLAFTRDARQLLVAHDDHVAWHATSGASRRLPINGVSAIAAFGDQLWTVGTAGLERWTFHGRSIGAGVCVPEDAVLAPAFAGPAAAAWGSRLWLDDCASVREVALAEGAVPFLGLRAFTVERVRGERVVRLGAASWALPHGASLLGAAALFDGAGVVLFVGCGDAVEAWSSTAAGVVRHQIKLPPGRVRLAARRGIALVHQGDLIQAIDLRYGDHLGTGTVPGEDIAIDPDGHYLATLCASEVRINTLGDAFAEHNQRSKRTMGDFDEILKETETLRTLGADALDAFGIPGASLMSAVNDGADLYTDVSEGNYDKAVGDGLGLVDDGFGFAEEIGFESPMGDYAKAIKGGYDMGNGIGQMADDDFDGKGCDGAHDFLEGMGESAEAFGPWGEAAGKGMQYGLDIGDAIAPYVYHDADYEGARTEAIPEDGIFKPTTGNKTVDWLFGVD